MTDCFALLGEPRRPWLDADELKAKFLAFSAEAHPDRFHSANPVEKEQAAARFAQLNAAYNCLRETKDRLAHLLELETGRRPTHVQAVPEEAMELFAQVGRLCREVDEFLVARGSVTAPLLKVQNFERGLVLADRVSELQQSLRVRQESFEAELKALNEAWAAAPAAGSSDRASKLPLAQLEKIYRAISFTSRWRAQLQERFVQLSM